MNWRERFDFKPVRIQLVSVSLINVQSILLVLATFALAKCSG